jgi:hypothetical protein
MSNTTEVQVLLGEMRNAAVDQSQFRPDCRKDNHHQLPFGLYPCDPCHPWFIPSWFLDHGLHGLHGWAGDRVGRGEQVAAPSRLEVCATGWARAGLHAADDQSQFRPDRRKDNHHRLPFGRYPCHPCNPWFIPSWFLDHGLHGLHGWAGDMVGRGEQVAAPSRLEVCATASACAGAGLHAADDQSQFRPDAGRPTTTSRRLAFIRVIRVIRGSFLACSSTTDYTDYTDGRGTGDSTLDGKGRTRRCTEPPLSAWVSDAPALPDIGFPADARGRRQSVIRVVRPSRPPRRR